MVRLDGILFTLLFRFNSREGFWHMDLLDSSEVGIRHGIKILEGFSRLRLIALEGRPPGDMIAIDLTGEGSEPGRDTLGDSIPQLYVEQVSLPSQ